MKCTPLIALVLSTLALSAVAQTLPSMNANTEPLNLNGAVQTVGFKNDYFVVACWVPNFFELSKWSGRGVNTAWYNEGINPSDKSASDISYQAAAAGMKVWRYPGKYMKNVMNDAFDATDGTLSAFSLIDEPVLHGMTPAAVNNQAINFRTTNANQKLILNVEGDKFVMPTPDASTIALYKAYMQTCDIGFVDWYVKNRNADRYPLSHLWTAVERLAVWGEKPVGAFIECSNQRISATGRAPTVGEMRGEVIGSIIYGGRLISYFPEVPGSTANVGPTYGTGNDGTPPDLEKEMIALNKQLQQLAPIIMAPGARITTRNDSIIAAVRWYNSKQYLIVFNNDPTNSVKFNGENLAPYDWRIYTAGTAPTAGTYAGSGLAGGGPTTLSGTKPTGGTTGTKPGPTTKPTYGGGKRDGGHDDDHHDNDRNRNPRDWRPNNFSNFNRR